MEKIIRQSEVNYFLLEIERIFPNFVAGILFDRNGFPIGSKIPHNFPIRENALALLAFSTNECFLDERKYLKIIKDLDRSKNIKLLLLLEKSKRKSTRLKKLKKLIKTQSIF